VPCGSGIAPTTTGTGRDETEWNLNTVADFGGNPPNRLWFSEAMAVFKSLFPLTKAPEVSGLFSCLKLSESPLSGPVLDSALL